MTRYDWLLWFGIVAFETARTNKRAGGNVIARRNHPEKRRRRLRRNNLMEKREFNGFGLLVRL